MKYELVLTYKDGTMKKETEELPKLMTALGIYMEDDTWVYAHIMNCQTGELIAIWQNNKEYGVETV